MAFCHAGGRMPMAGVSVCWATQEAPLSMGCTCRGSSSLPPRSTRDLGQATPPTPTMGKSGFQLRGGGGGGSIEPPKNGGVGGKVAFDRTFNQLL